MTETNSRRFSFAALTLSAAALGASVWGLAASDASAVSNAAIPPLTETRASALNPAEQSRVAALSAGGTSESDAKKAEKRDDSSKSEAAVPRLGAAPTLNTELVAKPVSGTLHEKMRQKRGESSAADDVRVKRLVVTHGVEDREPLSPEPLSTSSGRVVAFVELQNDSDVAETVVVTFESETGQAVGHIELEVPAKSPRWRTWGYTRHVKEAGNWQAVVSKKGGEELTRTQFSVSE
jgi:hypothetical protein